MGKVYATADLHGCGKVADKLIKYLQPDDKLYFIGDAIDRGPDGIKIFQSFINDPRVTFLKGNHEEMMATAIPFIWEEIENANIYNEKAYKHWFDNGGEETSKAFWTMTRKEVYKIKEQIDNMPLKEIYTSPAGHRIILEHAGFTPNSHGLTKHDPLWDRGHFHDNWSKQEEDKNIYIVHGHTPVQYLRFTYGYKGAKPLTKEEMKVRFHHTWCEKNSYKPEIIRYCDDHKFDIDLCTIISGRAALLDLDTFEVVYIDAEV